MTTDWLPGFRRIPGGTSSGAYTSPIDKLVIHFTQGESLSGAVSTLLANRSCSHVVVQARAAKGRERVQLVSLGEAARSLRNDPGGVQTNRDGVLQIELCGFSEHPEQLTEDDWLWLGREVVRPMCVARGVPIECSVTFHDYPPEGGVRLGREPWRMSAAAWTSYVGICGHQHVPENSHGDPGNLSRKAYRGRTTSAIELVLEGARGSTTPPIDPEEDEIMGAKDEILAAIDSLRPSALRVSDGEHKGEVWVVTADARWHVPDRPTLDAMYVLHLIQRDKNNAPAPIRWDQIDGIPLVAGPPA